MAVKSLQYNQHTFDISYEIVHPEAKIDIIFLHGWGSNKNLMKQVFSPFLQDFRHIYIDLLGFGKSSCDIPLTTDDYAKVISLFLTSIQSSKDIIVGHSFGGKVATLLQPDFLVLLGSAGIVVPKPFSIKAKIALFKILKSFGLTKFRSLFVADDAKNLSPVMYQTFKNVINEDFSQHFQQVKGKALLFWGKDDTATPLYTGEKIASLIPNASLEVYDGGHYFFMQNGEDIALKIQHSFYEGK
ncbi:2-hydroxy-6-oxohepta-2,4-dienoate hydrolase [hydrothermal vent metagenome]|uniref:2-hydroxy-6-oxohepta-2,4-dienoate hydrolase n=1 Tax=hydrothermal vent metagenome TaxID=652676 RepID=A0A1W1D392_9ZZZZ